MDNNIKNSVKVWGSIDNGKIEIHTLTTADLEEALNILDPFFLNESVCNGCEINLPESIQARKELRELCRATARDGISLVAKDATSGEVVAVAFNKIQSKPQEGDRGEPFFLDFRNKHITSPQARCLMDLMIEIDAKTDVFEIFGIDCVCELMFLATLPQWSRKGIATALARYTVELTRNLCHGIGLNTLHPDLRCKRPRAVTAIFSSLFSQKVGRSQGFKVLNSVPFTEFSYNGKTFDQRISPMHKGCEHVALLLD